MRVEHRPYNYDLRERFPQARRLFGYEGGAVFTAERDGKAYILIDAGTMADFLDENDPSDAEVMQRLVTIEEYDDISERDREAKEMLEEHNAELRKSGFPVIDSESE